MTVQSSGAGLQSCGRPPRRPVAREAGPGGPAQTWRSAPTLAANYVVDAAEGNQHLAVGGLPEPSSRREPAEEHHLGEIRLHFRADVALLHGIVRRLALGVNIQRHHGFIVMNAERSGLYQSG